MFPIKEKSSPQALRSAAIWLIRWTRLVFMGGDIVWSIGFSAWKWWGKGGFEGRSAEGGCNGVHSLVKNASVRKQSRGRGCWKRKRGRWWDNYKSEETKWQWNKRVTVQERKVGKESTCFILITSQWGTAQLRLLLLLPHVSDCRYCGDAHPIIITHCFSRSFYLLLFSKLIVPPWPLI